jgi:hypothetical protein
MWHETSDSIYCVFTVLLLIVLFLVRQRRIRDRNGCTAFSKGQTNPKRYQDESNTDFLQCSALIRSTPTAYPFLCAIIQSHRHSRVNHLRSPTLPEMRRSFGREMSLRSPKSPYPERNSAPIDAPESFSKGKTPHNSVAAPPC